MIMSQSEFMPFSVAPSSVVGPNKLLWFIFLSNSAVHVLTYCGSCWI